MRVWSILMLGTLVAASTLSVVAAPLQAGTRYGGIGAVLSHFEAQNAQGSGTPPLGAAYYRIDDLRGGRVAAYHVALNPQSKLSVTELKRLVTASQLPKDAKQIKGWRHPVSGSGYCAVYRSRWLGRRLYGRYVIVGVSARDQTAGAWVSTAPFCRG
jgi:hypothetical protein